MMKNIFRRQNSIKENWEHRRPAVTPQHFDYDEDIVKTITKHPKSKE